MFNFIEIALNKTKKVVTEIDAAPAVVVGDSVGGSVGPSVGGSVGPSVGGSVEPSKTTGGCSFLAEKSLGKSTFDETDTIAKKAIKIVKVAFIFLEFS